MVSTLGATVTCVKLLLTVFNVVLWVSATSYSRSLNGLRNGLPYVAAILVFLLQLNACEEATTVKI